MDTETNVAFLIIVQTPIGIRLLDEFAVAERTEAAKSPMEIFFWNFANNIAELANCPIPIVFFRSKYPPGMKNEAVR